MTENNPTVEQKLRKLRLNFRHHGVYYNDDQSSNNAETDKKITVATFLMTAGLVIVLPMVYLMIKRLCAKSRNIVSNNDGNTFSTEADAVVDQNFANARLRNEVPQAIELASPQPTNGDEHQEPTNDVLRGLAATPNNLKKQISLEHLVKKHPVEKVLRRHSF